MSQANAVRFLEDVQTNKDLQMKLIPAFDMEMGAWDAEKLKELSAENGYDFTYDELKSASKDIVPDELSDETLETIAGGGCSSSSCVTCCCSCCCCCTG